MNILKRTFLFLTGKKVNSKTDSTYSFSEKFKYDDDDTIYEYHNPWLSISKK